MRLKFLRLGVVLQVTALARLVPAAEQPSAAEINSTMAAAAAYEPGQSVEPFRRIEGWVAQCASEPNVRKEFELRLIELLNRRATYEARRFACKQLAVVGSSAALPALAKLLNDPETTAIACLALTTFRAGDADKLLRNSLGTTTGKTQAQIITTLGDRRDRKSVRALKRLADSSDDKVRETAISSLGKIGTPGCWRALSELRRNVAPPLQATFIEANLACAEHLAAAGKRKRALAIYEELAVPSQPAYARRSAFAAFMDLDEDHAERRVLEVLQGTDAVLRPLAISSVRRLRPKDASRTFAAELAKLSMEEQVWLIDSLAARGDEPARSAIEKCVRSSDAPVRKAAIEALGRIGGSSDVRLLAQAGLNFQDPEDFRTIESALVGLPGDGQTDVAMVAELENASPKACALLITCIARRQGASSNPLLLKQVANPDPMVAKAAFRALARTAGATEIPKMLSMLDKIREAGVRSEAEAAAAQALARIDDVARRSSMIRGVLGQSSSVDGRIALVSLLAIAGDAEALSAATAATADSDPSVREAAVRVLADWPDVAAWAPLLAIYREPENASFRGLAMRGLVRLVAEENARGDSQETERYTQLFANAQGDADLKLILGAIGGSNRPEALQLVWPFVTNPGVRKEVEVAVKKIAESIKSQHPEVAQEALRRLELQNQGKAE